MNHSELTTNRSKHLQKFSMRVHSVSARSECRRKYFKLFVMEDILQCLKENHRMLVVYLFWNMWYFSCISICFIANKYHYSNNLHVSLLLLYNINIIFVLCERDKWNEKKSPSPIVSVWQMDAKPDWMSTHTHMYIYMHTKHSYVYICMQCWLAENKTSSNARQDSEKFHTSVFVALWLYSFWSN